jgi:cyclic pyranopterin phosphate synthase
MPLDSKRAWQRELVVSKKEILERLSKIYELEPVLSGHPSETAKRWRFKDLGKKGPELGIIAPVTEPFCGDCNRIRLTADGKIRTCLFSLGETDLKPWLRGERPFHELSEQLRRIIWKKEARHHIGEKDFQNPNRSMSSIGG